MMRNNKSLILILLLSLASLSLFASKTIVGFSAPNLDIDSNYKILNEMLKTKFESSDYEYYWADSKNNRNIQYFSVIDMINENIDYLIINPVDQETFDDLTNLCKKFDIEVINLYAPFEDDYENLYLISYNFENLTAELAYDIKYMSIKENHNLDVVSFIDLNKIEHLKIMEYLTDDLNSCDLALSECIPISSVENLYSYESVISKRYSDITVLIFPTVTEAIHFHKSMIDKYGSDNFIKYCLEGVDISEDEMKENGIRGIFIINSEATVASILDDIQNGNFVDSLIDQKFITVDF